jgi:hypothetical protein
LIVAKPKPAPVLAADAGRGRMPTVEIFGEIGVLQARRGPAPAEVEVLGVKGVFGSVRGRAPNWAAAVAQGREAESNSEGVRAFLASHPDAELLPGGVVVRCTKTCYEMPAQLEDMEAHWKGRRYRRGYTTERKRREPAAKAEAIDAPVATNKKEEPTVDPLHAFVASHADAEFLPTGEPWATQPLPYLPSCPWWSYLTVNHHPAVDYHVPPHKRPRPQSQRSPPADSRASPRITTASSPPRAWQAASAARRRATSWRRGCTRSRSTGAGSATAWPRCHRRRHAPHQRAARAATRRARRHARAPHAPPRTTMHSHTRASSLHPVGKPTQTALPRALLTTCSLTHAGCCGKGDPGGCKGGGHGGGTQGGGGARVCQCQDQGRARLHSAPLPRTDGGGRAAGYDAVPRAAPDYGHWGGRRTAREAVRGGRGPRQGGGGRGG